MKKEGDREKTRENEDASTRGLEQKRKAGQGTSEMTGDSPKRMI